MMLGMLGGGENMSENLSGNHCITGREWGGGWGDRQHLFISVRGGRLLVSVPANVPAHRLLN